MKKMIRTFKEWSELTIEEKNQQINNYWISNRATEELKSEIIKDFLNKIKKYSKHIKKIYFGWSGWYSPTLFIEIKDKDRLRLPKIFDIFEIKKVYINDK